MQTALDLPPDHFNDHEKNLVANVREHGWFRTSVGASDANKGFTYTTGFWLTLNHPEIIVFSIPPDTAHNILWDIYCGIKNGQNFPLATPIPNIFSRFDAMLLPVAKSFHSRYPLSARWFYGTEDFPCLQLIWPDPAGLFPWQPGADPNFAKSQPDLSPTGRMNLT